MNAAEPSRRSDSPIEVNMDRVITNLAYWTKVQYRRFSKFANTIVRTVSWQGSNAMQLSYEMYFSIRWKNVVVNTRKRKKWVARCLDY